MWSNAEECRFEALISMNGLHSCLHVVRSVSTVDMNMQNKHFSFGCLLLHLKFCFLFSVTVITQIPTSQVNVQLPENNSENPSMAKMGAQQETHEAITMTAHVLYDSV